MDICTVSAPLQTTAAIVNGSVPVLFYTSQPLGSYLLGTDICSRLHSGTEEPEPKLYFWYRVFFVVVLKALSAFRGL